MAKKDKMKTVSYKTKIFRAILVVLAIEIGYSIFITLISPSYYLEATCAKPPLIWAALFYLMVFSSLVVSIITYKREWSRVIALFFVLLTIVTIAYIFLAFTVFPVYLTSTCPP
jgi:hypothetical protein